MKINVPEQEEKEIRAGNVNGKSTTLDALKMTLSAYADVVAFVRFRNVVCKLGAVTEDGKKVFWLENDAYDSIDDMLFNAEIDGVPLYNFQYAELIRTYTL